MLYASWLFQRIVPPVLSFSLGSLGFLTKFDYDGFPDTLTSFFRDGVTVSLRLRFEGTVMRSQTSGQKLRKKDLVEELIGEEADNAYTHRPAGTYIILNDIVVDRGPNPSMWVWFSIFSSRLIVQQLCLLLRFSEMTSTSPRYKLTESVSLLQQALLHTI